MVDLQNKSDDFIELYGRSNPLPGARAKVPLLHVVPSGNDDNDDDFILCESRIVAEYVAEKYGNGLLFPQTVEERAIMNLFIELCGSAFSYFPLLRLKKDTDDDFKTAVSNFEQGLQGVDKFLHQHHPNGPFLFGETFTLAECNIAPFLQRCCVILPEFTKENDNDDDAMIDPLEICEKLSLHRLKMWMEAVLSRQSVIETGVPNAQMIQNTYNMLERFASMETKK